MRLANEWKEYSIIATGFGEKLEDWNGVTLLRPDPQAIWPARFALDSFKGLSAVYTRSASGGGAWQAKGKFAAEWTISYKDLTFSIKPMGFKHTGLFPEQAANWDAMRGLISKEKLKRDGQIKALNLFAYTGGATVAIAKEGAFVTHVDAAKGMVERAKLNCSLSNIPQNAVRWIIDDCKKFLQREKKRGQTYDAIIMDPPSYGRGPDGSVFKLENCLFELVTLAADVLSDNPIFFLLNSYTTGLGATVMQNIITLALKGRGGTVDSYELALPTKEENIILPCGNCAFWQKGVQAQENT